LTTYKRVSGKWFALPHRRRTLDKPDELVKDVVYPVVSKPTLQALVKEFKATGDLPGEKVYTVMRSSSTLPPMSMANFRCSRVSLEQ